MHIVTTTSFTPRRLPSISSVAGQALARHAVRMADRDRAAVHVERSSGMPSLSRQ
jgi:hypothetical protein